MHISARSTLTPGIALTAAAAIAFAPLAIPPDHHVPTMPHVSVSDVRLAVSPAEIEAFIADIRAALDAASATVTDVAGVPGQSLIGVVDNIVALLDGTFSGLIKATDNPTLGASLTILKGLSVRAFQMLADNLGRINHEITATAAQVGDLLTSALTGSLGNVLVAVSDVANHPLSPASYAGLLSAGVAGGRLLVGNGLEAVQSLGDAGFGIVGIALDEVTFQFTNAVTGLSDLFGQLADASGSAIVEAVIGAVQGFAVAPALAVVNLGSDLAHSVLGAANAGFDLVLDTATGIVNPAGSGATVPADEPTGRSSTLAVEADSAPSDDAERGAAEPAQTDQATTDQAEPAATDEVTVDDAATDEVAVDDATTDEVAVTDTAADETDTDVDAVEQEPAEQEAADQKPDTGKEKAAPQQDTTAAAPATDAAA